MAIELGAAYISILPSTDKLAPAIRAELDAVAKESKEPGEESGKGFSEGFKGQMKAALGIGVGLLVGGGLVGGFTQALDQGQMNARLSAQLGLSEAESKRAGKVAGSLFSQNYGESMEEVNAGISSVIQNIDGMRGASEGTLTRISSKVLNTASVFEQDLGGTTRAVGQLLRNGLAKNADEALDILTVGFQNGADKSGDFLDTLNEYGTQFRKLGINGTTATGLISQGLKAGARDGDKVADALKEFAIRAADGSKTSADAFGAMGLDAEKMTATFAKGGESAAGGLQVVLDRLRAMKDPVAREAASVGLFGSQAEDLQGALAALDPSSAVAGLGKVGGAAKKAQDQMGQTPQSRWQSFTRSLQQGFVRVMGGKVIPALEDVVGWIDKNRTALSIAAGVIGVAAGAYLAYVGTVKVITGVTKAWAIAQAILNGAMKLNPIGLVVAAIVALVAVFVIAYKKSDTFRAIVDAAFAGIKKAAKSVADFFTQKVPAAFQKVKDAAGKAIGWVKQNWPKILAVLTGPIGLAVLLIAKNWGKIKAGAGAVKDFVVNRFSALVGWFRSMPGKISSIASNMWDGMKNSFRSMVNAIIGYWNNLSFTLNIPDAIPGLPNSLKIETPNIPMLAKGGLLTRATLNVAGEAGPEAVTPLDRLEGWITKAAQIGASNGEARAYANPSPVSSGGGRREFTITNWRTGEGYFREIAASEISDADEFGGTTRRMR